MLSSVCKTVGMFAAPPTPTPKSPAAAAAEPRIELGVAPLKAPAARGGGCCCCGCCGAVSRLFSLGAERSSGLLLLLLLLWKRPDGIELLVYMNIGENVGVLFFLN